jgi:hypothetical protein
MPNAGYQDWQRTLFEGGQKIVRINQGITAGIQLGIFNVQSWNSIVINITANDAVEAYQLQFAWYEDANAVVNTGSTFMNIDHTMQGTFTMPVLNQYLIIFITPKFGGHAGLFGFSAYGTAAIVRHYDTLINPGPLMHQTVVLGANANITALTSFMYNGRVTVNAWGYSGAGFFINLNYYNFGTGAYERFAQLGQPSETAVILKEIMLPRASWQAVINNGATGQTIELVISPISD